MSKEASNSEKTRPVALALVELCLSEGIRQAREWAGGWAGRHAVSQLVENSA